MSIKLTGIKTVSMAVVSPVYTIGIGQVLAVPGVLISGVVSSIFALKQCHFTKKMKGDSFKREEYNIKRVEERNRALDAAAATAFFALGAIPLIGGPLGIYAGAMILNKKSPPYHVV